MSAFHFLRFYECNEEDSHLLDSFYAPSTGLSAT